MFEGQTTTKGHSTHSTPEGSLSCLTTEESRRTLWLHLSNDPFQGGRGLELQGGRGLELQGGRGLELQGGRGLVHHRATYRDKQPFALTVVCFGVSSSLWPL